MSRQTIACAAAHADLAFNALRRELASEPRGDLRRNVERALLEISSARAALALARFDALVEEARTA